MPWPASGVQVTVGDSRVRCEAWGPLQRPGISPGERPAFDAQYAPWPSRGRAGLRLKWGKFAGRWKLAIFLSIRRLLVVSVEKALLQLSGAEEVGEEFHCFVRGKFLPAGWVRIRKTKLTPF